MPFFMGYKKRYISKKWIENSLNQDPPGWAFSTYSMNVKNYHGGWPADAGPYSAYKGIRGKYSRAVKMGYLCVADGYSPCGWPPDDYGNHLGDDGLPEGFNILFFDGSVKWVNDSNRVICTGEPPYGHQNCDRTSLMWNYTQNTLPGM